MDKATPFCRGKVPRKDSGMIYQQARVWAEKRAALVLKRIWVAHYSIHYTLSLSFCFLVYKLGIKIRMILKIRMVK